MTATPNTGHSAIPAHTHSAAEPHLKERANQCYKIYLCKHSDILGGRDDMQILLQGATENRTGKDSTSGAGRQ